VTQHEGNAQLRLDFVSFAQRRFRGLSPRTAFVMNWHIEIIAAKLMAPAVGGPGWDPWRSWPGVNDASVRRGAVNT